MRKAGLAPMTWEEIPLDWNVTIGTDVVVQSWLGDASVKTLAGKGHKVIDSNYNFWVGFPGSPSRLAPATPEPALTRKNSVS